MKDLLSDSNPLVEEFQKYLREEMAKGTTEESLREKLVGSKTIEELSRAMESGTQIDIEAIDIKLPEELEKRLEGIIDKEHPQAPVGSIEKGLPPDILSRLNKIQKK